MKNISTAILFLLMILAITAQAQTTAEITGRITDVSSAVVPGTAVKVTNVDKKIDRTTASNE